MIKSVRDAFALFAAVRILFAVATRTTHVPDETWQSAEIAHKIVFGYGYETWEWAQGLRTFLYPMLFVPPMYLLKLMGMDGTGALVVLPRITQGLISAVGDLYMFRLTTN